MVSGKESPGLFSLWSKFWWNANNTNRTVKFCENWTTNKGDMKVLKSLKNQAKKRKNEEGGVGGSAGCAVHVDVWAKFSTIYSKVYWQGLKSVNSLFRRLRARKALTLFKDVPLRTRRAQLLHKVQRQVSSNQKGAITVQSLVIAPFWFWTEHLWTVLMPFLLSADNLLTHKELAYIIMARQKKSKLL